MDAVFCTDLVKSLNNLRKEGVFCDVSLSVRGTIFPAHRNVLAANSPYFKALLSSEMKENFENVVKLDELEAKTVGSILDFMYSGKVTINKENALDLTMAADYMFLPNLKDKGCDFLAKKMNVSNCLTILTVAEKYNFTELHDKAQKFVQENFYSMSRSENFKTLTAKQVEDIIAGDDLVAKEEEVFESLVEWVMFDLDARRQCFDELFSHIRLIYLPRNYLIKVVEVNGLVKNSEVCQGYVAAAKQYFSSPDTAKQEGLQICQPRGCQHSVLATGGLQSENGYSVTSAVSLFVPTISKCFPVSPMLMPRKNHGIATYEGMVYAVGGSSNHETALHSVELYDPKTNSWSSVMSLRKEVTGVGVAVLGDYLYAVGGCDVKGSPLDVVQRYSPRLNKWQYISAMMSARTRHGVVAANGFLFSLGGYGSEDFLPLKTGELYDSGSDRWIYISPMKHRRSDMCCICVGQMIYIIGGEHTLSSGNTVRLNSCEMYEPATDTWTTMTPLCSPRSHSGVAAVRNKIYIFGGLDNESKELESIECFDTKTETWKTMSRLPAAIEGGACSMITLPGELMSSVF